MATAPATSDLELSFPPKGSLRRVAFPRLMREIGRKRLTGSLYLLSGQTKKVVFFDDGQPVFVRSNVLSECLGQILSSEGLITQEQCEQTLEAIRRTGKKQGELLVEMGILSEGNLRYGLEAQLRAKLYDIFGWEDGRYQFKNDPPNLQFGIRLDRTAEAVIIGAIQEQVGEERAAASLADSLDKYLELCAPPGIEFDNLELLTEERYFLECMDGSRTVAESVNGSVKPAVPTPNALVFALIQAGIAQFTEHGAQRKAQPEYHAYQPKRPPDEDLKPGFDPQDVVTEYEDTPLPGELPQVRGLLGDHEADFAGVDDLEASSAPHAFPAAARNETSVSAALVEAEPEAVEETFDDEELDLGTDEPLDISEDEQLDISEDEQLDISEDGPPLLSENDPLELSDDEMELVDRGDSVPRTVVEEMIEEVDAEPELIEPASSVDSLEAVQLTARDLETIADDVSTDADEKQPELLSTQADALVGGRPPSAGDQVSVPDDDLDLGDLAVDDDLLLGDDDQAPDDEPPLLEPDAAALEVDLDDVDLDTDLDDLDDLDLDTDLDDVDLDTDLDDLDDLDLDDLDLNAEPDEGIVELAPDAAESLDEPLVKPAPRSDDDELVDFSDLDAVDLGEDDDGPSAHSGLEATFQADGNPEMAGAMRFNEAETALNAAEFPEAVGLLEEAYENGFDVAELHAMLAYARFMAAGQDHETAQHAFELLDYAENMDPSLDLVHAYRGAIYRGLGSTTEAQEALARALELNPYCELAMQLMDELG